MSFRNWIAIVDPEIYSGYESVVSDAADTNDGQNKPYKSALLKQATQTINKLHNIIIKFIL